MPRSAAWSASACSSMTTATSTSVPSAAMRRATRSAAGTSDSRTTNHRTRLMPAPSLPLPDARLDVVHQHLDGGEVPPALGHDEVGVLLGGLHVHVVHGLHGVAVLVDDALRAAAALGDVAL